MHQTSNGKHGTPFYKGADMIWVDGVFAIIIVLSLLVGLLRGFVYELLSLFVWAGSFFTAQWLAPAIASLLPFPAELTPFRYIAAFALVFVISVFVAGLVVNLLKQLTKKMGLTPFDRVLGAMFGIIRAIFVCLILTWCVGSIDTLRYKDEWQTSVAAQGFSQMLLTIKPMLAPELSRGLKTEDLDMKDSKIELTPKLSQAIKKSKGMHP